MGVENYADVRVGYNDNELVVDLRIIDRQIWYEKESPSIQDLIDWDAVTLLLSTSSDPGSQLTSNEYKFIAQLNTWEDRVDYQAVYQGNASLWLLSDMLFTSDAYGSWQPDGGPNDNQKEDFHGFIRPHDRITFPTKGVCLYSKDVHARLNRNNVFLIEKPRDQLPVTQPPRPSWLFFQ